MTPIRRHEGDAHLAARPMVVPVPIDFAPMPLSRIGPASGMSVIFHLVLLGVFVLLAPRSQADAPLESVEVAVVNVESTADDARPAFDTIDSGFDLSTGGDLASNSPNPGEVSIPDFGLNHGPLGTPIGEAVAALQSVAPPASRLNQVGVPRSNEGASGVDLPAGPTGGAPGPARSIPGGPLGRQGAARDAITKGEASPASEAAVAKGLNWLVRVQSPAGMWKLDGSFPDKGNANDVGGTALGLLPFLGAGKTHRSPATTPTGRAQAQAVDKALQFLVNVQDKKTGSFSREMYAHGLATIAISEAFALSQDYNLKKPAQAAINFIVAAQHSAGGWRYSPGQAGDLSVSGWQIMALKSGIMAGLDVPPASLRRAQAFLDHVNETKSEGSGYTDSMPATPTLTSVALLCRQYLNGWGPANARLIKGIDNYLKPNFPRPERKDVYYYYYATQVMHNFGGDDWKAWNKQMRDQLVASQDNDMKDPARFGSWSPAGDQWGQAGGRLMVTSLNLLTLEVYYRYLPLYHRDAAR